MTFLFNLLPGKHLSNNKVCFLWVSRALQLICQWENLVYIHRSYCLHITRYDERVLLLTSAKGKFKMPQNIWNLKISILASFDKGNLSNFQMYLRINHVFTVPGFIFPFKLPYKLGFPFNKIPWQKSVHFSLTTLD